MTDVSEGRERWKEQRPAPRVVMGNMGGGVLLHREVADYAKTDFLHKTSSANVVCCRGRNLS